MAGLRDISVTLSATVAPFKAQMVAAGAAVNSFAGTIDGAAKKNNVAVKAMSAGMAAIGAAAVGAAALSVRSAMQMETRMQNVATIWTDTGTTVAQAGSQIVEMSKTLPQSANNLAEGLYQVASSGFQGAAGMQVLQASATAASAGLTTTSVAATGISAVLNAYGMKAGEAAHVSDVLFQTVNLGVVSFEELSQTLGDFVGLAATAHISIEDVTAAYATMTLNGVSASEAGTSVNRVIQSIIQPSKEMAAVLAAQGYASGQAAIDALGLKGVVELLSKATGGSATAMGVLVPEIRGLRGMLALTSAEGTNYNRVQGDMTDTAKLFGATQRALAEQSKSTSFQLGILKNTVMATGISFGQALLPVIKPIIGMFQALADTFNGIPGPLQTIVLVLGLATAVVVGLAGAYLLLAPRIAATMALMAESTAVAAVASVAMTALKVSMGVIGLALLVVTPLMMMFAKSHGEAKRSAQELKDALDQETGSVNANTAAFIAKEAVSKGLDKDAASYGISLQTLTSAMMGNAEAQAQVTARLAEVKQEWIDVPEGEQMDSDALAEAIYLADEFGVAVTGSAQAVGAASDGVKRDAAVRGAATSVVKGQSSSLEANAQAALDNAAALKTMTGALSQITSMESVLSAANESQGSGQSDITDTVKTAVNERHQVEKDALDRTQKVEKDSLDARNKVATDALDARQKIELDGLALIQRGVTEAMDLRFRTEIDVFEKGTREVLAGLEDRARAENESYAREARDLKAALDHRQRAEEDALDDRIALIDDEYDAKKKAEQRAYDAEVDRVQSLVDSTFGEEREGYKRQLINLEDSHDARLNTLEHAQTAEVRAHKETLADKHQAEQDALDDDLLVVKDALAERQALEKQAITDRQAAEKQAITDRQAAEKQAAGDAYTAKVTALGLVHTAEDLALATSLKHLTDNLDLQQQAVTRALTNRQTAEDNAADTRRSSGAGKAALTLSDIQAQFDKQQAEADQSFKDLAIIYAKGGGNVSAAMLAEIQKLPPKVQTELANAGQPAFDRFIESLRVGMLTKDLTQITNGALRIGGALGAGMTKGFTSTPNLLGGLVALPTLPKAEGSVTRQAMMSSRPILWAEAGPEAYIPLRRTNTARSLALTAQVAGYYGHALRPMADGGIIGGRSSGGGGFSLTVQVENHLAPGIDMGYAGRMIEERVMAGVAAGLDGVRRQVVAKSWR